MNVPRSTRPSVLITGASGFIGSRLGEALAGLGHRVTLVDRDAPNASEAWIGHGVRTVAGDVTHPSDWAHHLADIDVVVHSAGIHRVGEVDRDPETARAVNVGGTEAVLNASIDHGVDRFVFLSTSKVYGDVGSGGARETDPLAPADQYSRTKVDAEALCTAANERGDIETAVVRPFSVYGPNMDLRTGYVGALVLAATTGEPVSLSGGPDVARDFVHVDAVVQLLVALIGARRLDHQTWNSGSGHATTLDELVATFRAASGLSQSVTYRTAGPGTVMHTSADMTRSRSLVADTGPELGDGLRATLESHRPRTGDTVGRSA